MKKILVPTDFSATASNAVNATLDLAVTFDAQILLYTCLEIPPNWDNFTEAEKNKYPEAKQLIHNAEVLFKDWKEQARTREVSLSTTWTGGKLLDNIQEIVAQNEIDLVVMGSHGASGKNEYFIGSNAQKVVRSLHCPVLIIKDDLENYQLDKIIFASDFDPREKPAFEYLLKFSALFDSEIHLVAINTTGWFGQPALLINELMQDFADLCGDRSCSTHFFRGSSIDLGVRTFSEEIGADMIAISNLQKSPLKRMLIGSNVEALVNHARIPVLSIDLPESES